MNREVLMLVSRARLLAVPFGATAFSRRSPLEQRSDAMQLNGQNPNPGTLLPWQQGHDKLCELHGRLHVCKRAYPLYKPTRAVGTGSVNYSIDPPRRARMTAADARKWRQSPLYHWTACAMTASVASVHIHGGRQRCADVRRTRPDSKLEIAAAGRCGIDHDRCIDITRHPEGDACVSATIIGCDKDVA